MPPQDPPLPGWMQGAPAVQTFARTLLARYPAAFRAEGAEVRPLKIGIDRDLQQALDVDPAVLRTVLGAIPAAAPIGLPSLPPGRCASTSRASRWSRSRPRISSGRGRARAPRPGRRAAPGRRPP